MNPFKPLLAAAFFSSIASAATPADLVRLYEEEILAHDLYVKLGKIHPEVRPLQNIPNSEKRHREAMAAILKQEDVALPTPTPPRRFVSDGLDALFTDWLAEGKKSAVDACRVGVRLEEHDIADLRKAKQDFPNHRDTLAQLESASNRHLWAFHRHLTMRGGKYTPQALPAADFQGLVTNRDAGSCTGCAAGRKADCTAVGDDRRRARGGAGPCRGRAKACGRGRNMGRRGGRRLRGNR